MQIFVKTPEGKVITVIAIGDTTIDMVKAVISHKEDIPKIHQSLSFNDKQLEDDHTLSDYNIQNESMLTLNLGLRDGVGKDDKGKDKNDKGSGSDKGKNNSDPDDPDDDEGDDDDSSSDSDMMQVNVKLIITTGMIIKLQVEASDTIYNLKKILKNLMDTPIKHQRLIYHDQQLEDDHTLSDYNIQNESMLHLGGRLRGGAPKKKRKDNPFLTEAIRMAQEDDLNYFEASFKTALEITMMESADPIVTIQECNLEDLERLRQHLTQGTSHHMFKLESASDVVPNIASMLLVKEIISNSYDKHRKLLASALWRLGCSEDSVELSFQQKEKHN